MLWRFLALAAVACALPPTARAATVCGPAPAKTVAASADVRVYERAGTLTACHRRGGPRRSLGARSRALGVWAAGSRVAVRRAFGTGERLSIYSLRSRARIVRKDVAGSFRAVALDPRGPAVFVERTRDGELWVSATRGDQRLWAEGAIATSLRFAGGVVTWRDARGVRVFGLLAGTRRAQTLARLGNGELSVRGGLLRFRRHGARLFVIDSPITECTSSQGCSGVYRVRAVGAFLAVEDVSYSPDGSEVGVTVYNARTGRARGRCDLTERRGTYRLTSDGSLTCPPPA